MKTIGITGGVGAGKSTVLNYMESHLEACVLEADKIGHLVMEPDGPCYDEIIGLFGKDVIIYVMDEIGIRDNKYTTAMGMIKYFSQKMAVRGKEYSMISQEDEHLLLTPEDKRKKETHTYMVSL